MAGESRRVAGVMRRVMQRVVMRKTDTIQDDHCQDDADERWPPTTPNSGYRSFNNWENAVHDMSSD
ncbi:MAG: hypothetical protein QGE95_09185 [Arenicellales bacterium]|nr:hypothetical protein [Arenicellales bacterium]